MTSEDQTPAECCVRHWLPHPAATVYAALLDPATLAHWYGPDGLHVEPGSAYVDAREGGSWRLVLTDDGHRDVRVGVERTLRRLVPDRVVEAEEQAPPGSRVTDDDTVLWRVRLDEDTAGPGSSHGTTIEVREGPLSATEAELGAAGWGQALARLETVLGRAATR